MTFENSTPSNDNTDARADRTIDALNAQVAHLLDTAALLDAAGAQLWRQWEAAAGEKDDAAAETVARVVRMAATRVRASAEQLFCLQVH